VHIQHERGRARVHSCRKSGQNDCRLQPLGNLAPSKFLLAWCSPTRYRSTMKPMLAAVVTGAVALASSALVSAQSTQPGSASPPATGAVVPLNLAPPVYPPLARQARISEDVIVVVTVQPDGASIPKLESGHAMLAPAALDAARRSHFECRGCGAPVSYRLLYSFQLTQKGDCCEGWSPAQVTIQPELNNANGQRQTQITITAEASCLCDPSAEIIKKRSRSLKCLYLWRCS
jgi:hypothetical protein